ncbi:MAG: ribosome biogenesis GTP-binding protein YihA/YsxC [Firmicutes bacterium]|nr:ribosome biogenesis GTP-binding protein YihA/YsxC [Bacillota bacterium]MCL1954082.1 ribosome biogenesis GTP-binding protein YihA/YsxC [Bacillota bacterium]
MNIKIKSAKFLYSRTKFEETRQPEICMVGRSNAGKSSLINMLVGQKGLAKSSSTPGRTRLINYFEVELIGIVNDENINSKVILVDLPGYGYSKSSKADRELWNSMIDDYLSKADTLSQCFLLVDSRHSPMESDIQAAKYLYSKRLPFMIIGAKSDKLSKSQINNSASQIATGFRVGRDNIIMTSATTGIGRQELLTKIWGIGLVVDGGQEFDDKNIL